MACKSLSYYVTEVAGTMQGHQKTAKNWTSVSLSYYIFTGQQFQSITVNFRAVHCCPWETFFVQQV